MPFKNTEARHVDGKKPVIPPVPAKIRIPKATRDKVCLHWLGQQTAAYGAALIEWHGTMLPHLIHMLKTVDAESGKGGKTRSELYRLANHMRSECRMRSWLREHDGLEGYPDKPTWKLTCWLPEKQIVVLLKQRMDSQKVERRASLVPGSGGVAAHAAKQAAEKEKEREKEAAGGQEDGPASGESGKKGKSKKGKGKKKS
jgi:hypothetical protein